MTKINLRWLQNMKWSGRSIFLFVFFLCFDFFLVLFVVVVFFFMFLEIYFGFFNRCLTDCL